MTRRLWITFAAVWVLAAIGCSADDTSLTQVMVVVDSDMADVGSVRVRVEGMGTPKTAKADDLEKHPLPRTVALVHRGGPLGPITVTAEAFDGDTLLVTRTARLSFVRGRNVTLEMVLERSCIDRQCDDDDETCIDGSCQSNAVDAKDLSSWTGKIDQHREDAGKEPGDAGDDSGTGMGGGSGSGGESGAPSAGKSGNTSTGGSGGTKPNAGSGGTPVPRTCPGGCSFDSATTKPNGTISCEDGTCVLHCDPGFRDADQTTKNGCEMPGPIFGWKVSNIDPTSPQLMAASVPLIAIDCTSGLDLGSGALPATVQLCSTTVTPVLVPQPGGPDVVVIATQQLIVTSGEVFTFSGSRPVVFVVYGDADIEGQLDVSAKGATSGAGVGSGTDCGLGGTGENDDRGSGGGGGGFGSSGGKGGDSTTDAIGGAPGAVSANATLVPLRGGCSGGAGGQGTGGKMAAAGAGGGALQISVSGALRVGGTLAAAGGGGQGNSGNDDGGAGGGSGGGILLEATTIETTSNAWLTANGGGGGEGALLSSGGDAGADGAHASMSVAVGGAGNNAGGNGAAGTTAATAAPGCSLSFCPAASGGGGGGGVGRIVLRSAMCTLSGKASPSATCSDH